MKRTLIFLLFSIYLSHSFAQSKYEQAINQIRERFNCDENYAKWIVQKVDEFCTSLESDIEYVANSNDSYQSKIGYIDNTVIKNHFVNRQSQIDISSVNTQRINTTTISQYLYSLAKIKEKYGYTKVELLFDPDYLGIGTFHKVSSNCYELSVSIWQIFRAWKRENISYSDATRKKLRLLFFVDKDGYVTDIKTDRIAVAQTVPIDRYNKIIQ